MDVKDWHRPEQSELKEYLEGYAPEDVVGYVRKSLDNVISRYLRLRDGVDTVFLGLSVYQCNQEIATLRLWAGKLENRLDGDLPYGTPITASEALKVLGEIIAEDEARAGLSYHAKAIRVMVLRIDGVTEIDQEKVYIVDPGDCPKLKKGYLMTEEIALDEYRVTHLEIDETRVYLAWRDQIARL